MKKCRFGVQKGVFGWFTLRTNSHSYSRKSQKNIVSHARMCPTLPYTCPNNQPFSQNAVFLLFSMRKPMWSVVLGQILSEPLKPPLARAWPGALTLPNIRDSSKTNSAINVKLGRPSHTTILHGLWICDCDLRSVICDFLNSSEFLLDMVDFVTSLHFWCHVTFGPKLAKLRGSMEDIYFLMKIQMENTKRRKTTSSARCRVVLDSWINGNMIQVINL